MCVLIKKKKCIHPLTLYLYHVCVNVRLVYILTRYSTLSHSIYLTYSAKTMPIQCQMPICLSFHELSVPSEKTKWSPTFHLKLFWLNAIGNWFCLSSISSPQISSSAQPWRRKNHEKEQGRIHDPISTFVSTQMDPLEWNEKEPANRTTCWGNLDDK